jgi:hypothetical protein
VKTSGSGSFAAGTGPDFPELGRVQVISKRNQAISKRTGTISERGPAQLRRTVPETDEVVSKPVPGDAGNAANRIDTASRAPNIDATRINIAATRINIEATRINIEATRINIDATGRNSGTNGVKIVSTRIGRGCACTDPGSTRCDSGSESPKTRATRTDPASARSVRP